MSATNRGAEREDSDNYVTPDWCAARFLERYPIPQGATVLDPCCSSGELLTAIKKLRPDLNLIGFELREECRAPLQALVDNGTIAGFAIGSFFELAKQVPSGVVAAIVSNPPYGLAQEFIEAGEKIAAVQCYLLRINFVGSQERFGLTDRTRPGMLTLANRPSFTGWGGDATEYAWFIYGDSDWRGRWEPLPLTPDTVIAAANKSAREKYPHLNPLIKQRIKAAKKQADDYGVSALIPTGTVCGSCALPQFATAYGVTCSAAHIGARSLLAS